MSKLFKNGTVFYRGKFQEKDFIVDDNGMMIMAEVIDLEDFEEIIDCTGIHVFPGLINMDSSLQEITQSQIEKLSKDCAEGGYTTTFITSNSNEFNSRKAIQYSQENMKHWAQIEMYPIANAMNNQESVDIEELSKETFLFTTNEENIEALQEIMRKCAEQNNILNFNGQETEQLQKKLQLAKETGCQCHVWGVRDNSSLELIERYQSERVLITASVDLEVLLKEEKSFFLDAIARGTISLVSVNENDIVTNIFGVMYTNLVKEKLLTLEKVVEILSDNPARVFDLNGGEIINLEKANLSFFNLVGRKKVKSKSCFDGQWVMGTCCMTLVEGIVVYRNGI